MASKVWKLNHPEKYRAYRKLKKAASEAKVDAWLLAFKLSHPCACGESDPVCIDFHHRNSAEKTFGIGSRAKRTMSALRVEIEKCVCLCANCHRKGHAGRPSVAHAGFFKPVRDPHFVEG